MKFIEVEGIDASGKTTLTRNLYEHFKDERTLKLVFPDHTSVTGSVLRAWLGKEWTTGVQYIDALAFQCLQIVNRLDLMPEDLNDYDYLIADRYYMSGLVYGSCDGLDMDWLISVQERLPKPDISFYLKVPVSVSFERKDAKKRDRYEENRDYIERVAAKYDEVFDRLKGLGLKTKFYELDGTKSEQDVLQDALDIIRAQGLSPTARLHRLAALMQMAPLPGCGLSRYAGQWWLIGCAGGDQPLPQTRDCKTELEALSAAEAWFAPEIDGMDDR